ncbi:MAG: LysR substrate-binding domain-containing protein [Pigmentiphaga sp.]|uniref:LysR substrate-binding domain-containing protein n=1 Tax=Pigmentiphaga sp. TaxID=1977564 RepID=UPI0029A35F27|nr:LysR substrate-binding domain-containing protein [Pigmentiphaga sp.]MDX3904484.1 LysR substrate-binding domain-containing protein [Pigmentiphaga sp.]
MKLQQIRALCAVVDHDMSVSRAARALHTTQSAISKQVGQLEDSLGAALLIRSKSRILGLTDVGEQVLRCMRGMLAATEDIAHIVADHRREAGGRLAIATTHTHARYALHDIVPAFARRHPGVGLHLVQATPMEIADLVATGGVDIGLSTAPQLLPPSLATIPCYELKHVLIGERGHPVFTSQPLTLQAIARYPLITYSEQHAIGRRVNEAFAAAGLVPQIAVRGTDVEIMKSYAATGVGLAVIPVIAYSRSGDRRLHARPVDHLFPTSTVYVLARRGAYWPGHLYEFVGSLAPGLTRAAIEKALLSTERPD